MKKILVILFLLPVALLAHPLKMSLVYMDYMDDDKILFVECRFFADDFALAVEDETNQPIKTYNWSVDEQNRASVFIKKHIKIKFSERNLNLDPYEVFFDKSQKVVTLRYQFNLELIDGDEMFFSNNILFKQFGYAQTNVLQIEIPRIAETMIQSDQDDYTLTFKVKK